MTPADLRRPRIRVCCQGRAPVEHAVAHSGTYPVDGLDVTVDVDRPGELRWSVANGGPLERAIDAVGVVFDAGPTGADPALFAHGYQSWSPARVMWFGRDQDPSHSRGTPRLVRAAHHADPGRARPGELRSEQVTVVRLRDGSYRLVGFTAGDEHAGTLRATVDDGRVHIEAQAWLGGAILRPGERRDLHAVVAVDGAEPLGLLEEWATLVGTGANARSRAAFTVGWCSWYQYFHRVAQHDVDENLGRVADWPFDVFQVDDGYQRAIGDWLVTNDRFPRGVEEMAGAIARTGCTPGIWIAPFLAAPDSNVARDHPEWIALAHGGREPAIGMFNAEWGGAMWQLDTTRDDVLAHLESLAARLVAAGYRYLKLDFTFSAALPGEFADPTRTPAQRVRAGFDAIRRGAGDDVFVLGCGAPLGAVVGLVDGMRIGADVAPRWEIDANEHGWPGYERAAPATANAFLNTCTRSFMHRRLWSNDPDCVMLRASATELSPDAAASWARTVACSGGLVLVSDDLGRLGATERDILDEVITRARESDAAALAGASARPDELFDPGGPDGLVGPAGSIRVDPTTGSTR